MRRTSERPAAEAERAMDMYELALLAGGPRRVVETALMTLRERGTVTIVGPRVRAGSEDAGHPVERALTALCPRSRSLDAVRGELRTAPEVEEAGRRLVARGLLSRTRRRPTRAGRRALAAARREGTVPAYVFDGPAAVRDRTLRRAVFGVDSPPSGLGRRLVRMGEALDSDSDRHSDSGWGPGSGAGHGGGGHSCGGGGD